MKAIVIEVPHLHLGYLGCYGNDWIETPNIDGLAATGVVFDRHYVDCPKLPLSTSWTGRYVFPLPEESRTAPPACPDRLAESLKASNVARHVVSTSSHAKDAADHPLMHVVFDTTAVLEKLTAKDDALVWVRLPSLAPPWQIPEQYLEQYFAVEEPDAEEPNDVDQTEPESLKPWLDPPFGPMDTNDELACWQRLQITYAAAVSHVDAAVGLLLQQIDNADLGGDLLVGLTADRGLALGEHGFIGDWRPWLHEELVHLPLIVRLPNHAQAGRRVRALTQPVDLLPTLLAAFDADVSPELHGHSLLPLARGQVERVRDYVCSGLAGGDRLDWALRTPQWTYLLPVRQAVDDPPRSPQLYVKPDDRWEVNNLLQHHLDLADGLEQTLRAFVDAAQKPGVLAPPPLPAT
jgi:arylsulfatase A-like enzyme